MKHARLLIAAQAAWPAALLSLATPVRGQSLNDIPDYAPAQSVEGCIRSWGSPEMGPVMKRWEAAFAKYQPGITFADNLKGNDTAQVPLAFKVADLALMDRNLLFIERYNMWQRRHHWVTLVSVATGSSDTPGKACALAIFVHKDNPLAKLTLKQLDGIFGEARTGAWDEKLVWHAEAARTSKDDIRTWGQLGLTGEWADREIQVYGYDLTVNGFAFAFQRNVFHGGDSWNPSLREFPISEPGRKGAVSKSGARQMMKTLGADKYGIALGATKYGREEPRIKPLALAFTGAGPYVAPSRESFINWTYPLLEPICIYINRAPGKPLDPKIKDFVRYILSSEGQAAVVQEGTYLPLTDARVREELHKLD